MKAKKKEVHYVKGTVFAERPYILEIYGKDTGFESLSFTTLEERDKYIKENFNES